MVDTVKLNKLYNALDLYIVSSRIEGGPQAILECAITKTPILSTDVGVASEILHSNSIYSIDDFNKSKVDIDYAYQNAQLYKLPDGMKLFKQMFWNFYEN
jgi:glycosyltransferase involved in cell wall biosynthesis